MQRSWITGFIWIVFLSVICLAPVMAEDQQTTTESPVNYSHDALKSFIIANVRIYQLQQQMTGQLQNSQTDEQRVQLIQATNEQMGQVLQKVGLTAEEYNAMGQAIQSSAQLQEKINSIAAELAQQQQQP